MRVGFNARLLYAPARRGLGRYAINLLSHLTSLGVELVLYSQQPLHESNLSRLQEGRYSIRVSPPMNYFLWEQRWLPQQCAEDGVDVLHSPWNFGLPFWSPCPRVLTLHDAIDQVYYASQHSYRTRLSQAALKTKLFAWIARTRASQVVTVSQHAKGDLTNHLGIPRDKITVIYEAADPRFHEPISQGEGSRLRVRLGLLRPYVLYIGGWEQRKNVPFLIRAFAAADLEDVDLVLAGGTDDQRAALLSLAETLGIAGRLRLLGWVDEAYLPALYANALCFVYPSKYEGFGLQLCEAMAVGCPILAARCSSLPEVLETGGETFSLGDTNELQALLRGVVRDSSYRARLVESAQHRSAKFSWRITAEETLAVYRRALEAA